MGNDGGESGNDGDIESVSESSVEVNSSSSEAAESEVSISENETEDINVENLITEDEVVTVYGKEEDESEVVSDGKETKDIDVEDLVTDEEIIEAYKEEKETEIVSNGKETEELRDPTLTEEQLEIVKDMEQKGELEPAPSQAGETIVGGTNARIGEIHVDMPYNSDAKYDSESFIWQAQDQEAGLNQLTVQEFLDNYEQRQEYGRSKEGTDAQMQYTDGLEVSLIDDKMKEGKSYEQAQKEAAEELAGMAALHNPDQVAGGNPVVISSVGDSSVNSALGSLWGHGRAEQLYTEISEIGKNMTPEERATTYLNIRIDTHPRS